MFKQEAIRIGDLLSNIPLKYKSVIANIGSSTALFRQEVQPHIHEYIFLPLAEKSYIVHHIDIKQDTGVDIVADITKPAFAHSYADSFDIIICTNMLEHVEDITAVTQNLYAACRNDGYLLITVPYKYKKHPDPIDNMFRPKPSRITALFNTGNVKPIAEEIITIKDRAYYKKKKSRYPLWSYREIIGYYIGRRYKVSVVLLKVIK